MARGYVFRGSLPTRMARAEGEEIGRKEGREEGREETLRDSAFSMFLQHFDTENVRKILRIPKEKAEKYYQKFLANEDKIREDFQRKDSFTR